MKTNEKFAIIADDYTGAGDSGIHFSRTGRQIDLLLQGESLDEQLLHSHTVSLTTESRFLSPEQAASAVSAIISRCHRAGFRRFFKKIDSTLRGNPGSEIESALNVTGHAAALICTAMPNTGRTCLDGSIYLNGIPLHKTEIGDDPFNPIATSSIADLLGQQTSLPVGKVSVKDIEADGAVLAEKLRSFVDKGIRLIVADAVTDSHLQTLAGQIDVGDFLPVGAGGFARALAETHKSLKQTGVRSGDNQVHGPILAIVGSLSGISRRQAELACASSRFQPFDINMHSGREDIERRFLIFLTEFGRITPNILVRVSDPTRSGRVSKKEGERVALLLGEAAAVISRLYKCRTVFSTGGSTSMGVARSLGIGAVTLVDEIMPGVVLGSCSVPDTGIKWFISKAGGFGDQEILNNIAGLAGSTRGV